MNLKFPESFSTKNQSWFIFPALIFCGAFASAAKAQSADEILRAVRQNEAKIQYSATQIVQSGAVREVATLYRSGLKRRLEWSAPSVKAGDILIDDGQIVTLYHRADKTAIQTRSFRRVPGFAAGNWKAGAPTPQNGRLVRVLSRGKGRKISVDTKANVILRTENGRSITALQNIKFSPVSDAKFEFAKPAGVALTRINGRLVNDLNAARRLTTWVQPPSQLPSGYVFESAVAGKDEIWLRYTNGQKRFSIFEQKTSDSSPIAPQKVDGGWFWRKSGLRFLVTGAPEGAIDALAGAK
ncbi:hypothetical protein B1R32_103131 [Abditibacterium utsteinense]|uniref:Outer membrane lipoprotein-sorting protein n=1 Tax=Abditibacterium utsteinense TaxID=1960156 RepID=A0A2S8SVQ6_9BACT|nr:hypothetical protein [Abditibacterium utsteinense]PQV64864.1 hypothetical protein B1R32_103131 [Abditibacterium utsteinense]